MMACSSKCSSNLKSAGVMMLSVRFRYVAIRTFTHRATESASAVASAAAGGGAASPRLQPITVMVKVTEHKLHAPKPFAIQNSNP